MRKDKYIQLFGTIINCKYVIKIFKDEDISDVNHIKYSVKVLTYPKGILSSTYDHIWERDKLFNQLSKIFNSKIIE